MALAPTLSSIEALYRKLERELYRAYHHRNAVHKADHFFNFCVTAHSMRDYFFERLGKVERTDRQPFENEWSRVPLLVATADIANSAKHFILRCPRTRTPRTPATKRVALRRSSFIDIYTNEHGDFRTIRVVAPDVSIAVSDGQKYNLYAYMTGILRYWCAFLLRHEIRIRRQSIAQLRGITIKETR